MIERHVSTLLSALLLSTAATSTQTTQQTRNDLRLERQDDIGIGQSGKSYHREIISAFPITTAAFGDQMGQQTQNSLESERVGISEGHTHLDSLRYESPTPLEQDTERYMEQRHVLENDQVLVHSSLRF